MRYFEKVSLDEFKKEFNEEMYNEYSLPKRATKNSAGYDICVLLDYVIKPHEIKKIPTGLKVKILDNEVMLLIIRSSLGFKNNIRLTNQVGVIDSDYYNNLSNEGHIYISIQNEGDKDFVIKKGEAIAQGIFINYLKVDGDTEDADRIGGIGSTNEGGNK